MIAIIGSQGFIGKRLVSFLREQKLDLVEYSSKTGNLINNNQDIIENFDLPENCTSVIFLAQSPNYRLFPEKYEELIKINSLLPFSVGKKAIEKKVRKFIYFSTGSVYHPSVNPISENDQLNRGTSYALSKIFAEESLKLLSSSLDICCLRPFTMFGPGQTNMLIPNLTNSILKGLPISLDKIEGQKSADGLKISLMYIEDVVRAIHKLINSENLPKDLNLASPVSMSIKDISLIIGEAVSRKVDFSIKESARAGDLVADTELLSKYYKSEYLDFQNYITNFSQNIKAGVY